MTTKLTNYQCPSCSAPLEFRGESGLLECEYCGSAYAPAEIEALYAGKEEDAAREFAEETQEAGEYDTSRLNTDWGGEEASMRAYNCPSCGAELICDETTAATACPYCGNPTVVPGRFGGTLKPDYIIPFKVEREAAIAALKAHYKGKLLLPKAFRDANHLEEIQGVYVPFWLFDSKADADVTFHATKVRIYRQGDEEITEKKHYRVRRAGSMEFTRIPVDASTKMPDDHMDSIEPFDYSALVPFSTAYLPGYLANKYDVDMEQSAPRADERCRNSAVQALESTVHGYTTVSAASQSVRLERGQVHYALMPVWMLRTKWQDKEYLFAMNGQTGKMVGDLPVSKGKLLAWFAGSFAALFAIMSMVL